MEYTTNFDFPVRGETVSVPVAVVWYDAPSKRVGKDGLIQTGSVTATVRFEGQRLEQTISFRDIPGSSGVTLDKVESEVLEIIDHFRKVFENRFQVPRDTVDGGNWGFFGNNDM